MDAEIFYWRSTSQIEIDFIVKTRTKKLYRFEVKASEFIKESHSKPFRAFEEDFKLNSKIIVSNERLPKKLSDVTWSLPYKSFCKKLWHNEIIR